LPTLTDAGPSASKWPIKRSENGSQSQSGVLPLTIRMFHWWNSSFLMNVIQSLWSTSCNRVTLIERKFLLYWSLVGVNVLRSVVVVEYMRLFLIFFAISSPNLPIIITFNNNMWNIWNSTLAHFKARMYQYNLGFN